MAVEIDVTYDGRLSCTVVHGPSGATIRTTAPKDNGGDGSLFSPTDLAAAALATCTVTIMALAAAKHGIDLAGTTVHVEKHMSDRPPRRIARLPLTITVPAAVDERHRKALEAAAEACPVRKSLGADVLVPIVFRWGRGTHGEAK